MGGPNAGSPKHAAGPLEEPMLRLLAAMLARCCCWRWECGVCVRWRDSWNRALHSIVARAWAGLHLAVDFYLRPETRGALALALGLSLIFQASQVVLNIVLARAVGLALPGAVFWWLVPALALASLLPIGLGGLGVRCRAAVALLANSGLLNTSAAIDNNTNSGDGCGLVAAVAGDDLAGQSARHLLARQPRKITGRASPNGSER